MNMLSRSFILAALVLAGTVSSMPCWAQSLLRAAGQDVAPWVVKDKNSSALSGIYFDLVNAVAKDLGRRAEYQVMTFADLIPAVNSDKIDIIATNMAFTTERQQLVDFSNPIYEATPRPWSCRQATQPHTEAWRTSKVYPSAHRREVFNSRFCNEPAVFLK